MGKAYYVFILVSVLILGVSGIVTHQVTEFSYGCACGVAAVLALEHIIRD